MSLVLLAVVSTLATRAAPARPPCPETTLEMRQCLSGQLAEADTERMRYVQAARQQIKDKDMAGAAEKFDAGEKLWTQYRAVTCDAVDDDWADGTIHSAMALNCGITLTRLHTHVIWNQWLTYVDNTPPVLPEPAVPARGLTGEPQRAIPSR